jgi:FlaA1/EpsC-like NDP-sugar epimerase
VLLTFAVLLQFGSFLSSGDRAAPVENRLPGILRAFVMHRRRLLEVAVDFALIVASFTVAFIVRVQGEGTPWMRHIFDLSIPVVLAARYAAFIAFGLYRGVWRYAGARDAVNIVCAVVVSEVVAFGVLSLTVIWNDFPRGVFIIDAFICTALIGASRFGERAIDGVVSELRTRGGQRRTLIVGAGRGGRSLLRELRETPGERVIGFVDDDASLRRRRLQGVPVLGQVDEIGLVLGRTHPDAVLVTIPDAARDRLDAVVEACGRAGVPCRFVRREIDLDPRVVLGATAD